MELHPFFVESVRGDRYAVTLTAAWDDEAPSYRATLDHLLRRLRRADAAITDATVDSARTRD
jgi:hypothetical protein